MQASRQLVHESQMRLPPVLGSTCSSQCLLQNSSSPGLLPPAHSQSSELPALLPTLLLRPCRVSCCAAAAVEGLTSGSNGTDPAACNCCGCSRWCACFRACLSCATYARTGCFRGRACSSVSGSISAAGFKVTSCVCSCTIVTCNSQMAEVSESQPAASAAESWKDDYHLSFIKPWSFTTRSVHFHSPQRR